MRSAPVKTTLIAALSAVLGFLALYLVYIKLENFSAPVMLAAVCLSGVVIGAGQGFFLDRRWHKVIGNGTFIGIFILCLPAVAATYGFALLVLPLLVAYAWLVLASARFGASLRK
ncbi:hypothetical protein [Duganella qianjiadongensis]|uniref:Uncharacterized protein n=1 Tax=Duganella qianjiadongensis TaxID=2692176 RepID=A0ABW9VFC5_9BURK|nr:hypothetical protein [Duganella qianjiadongensis]MYM37741.1 hypothetical protein [Duganella qianjiadongensis]